MNRLRTTLQLCAAIAAGLLLTKPVYGQCAPTFAPSVNYDVGSNPYVTAIGDLNGDGRPDLAVANSASSNVSVLLGNGDGTFVAPVNYASGNWPQCVAIGDFNGDGRKDLVTANNLGHSVSVLLGNGDGTFQAAVEYASGGDCETVLIGDLNGDARPDLVTSSYHADIFSVFLGNGDGTFQPAVNRSVGSGPTKPDLGDLNGDGRLDLAIPCTFSSDVKVFLGNGDGTFGAPVSYGGGGSRTYSVAIGDVSGDSRPDLVTTNFASDIVSVLLGNGDGTFQTAVNYAVGDYPIYATIGDLNGDGRPDIAVSNGLSDNLSVLLGNGNGTFQAAVNYGAGDEPNSVVIGDVNADGRLDVVTTNWSSNNVSVLLFTTPCGSQTLGTIVAWGDNTYGQCNVPVPDYGFIAVAAGSEHSLGLKSAGSIVAWGNNNYGQCGVSAPNSGFIAIAAGGGHSLGLRADGSIAAWGLNTYGQCNVPAPNSGFIAVAAGSWHSLGLKANGSVVAWGLSSGIPTPNSGFTAIAAADAHNLALRSDGSIAAWGWDCGSGRCNVPSPNSGFIGVAAHGYHSLGLKSDGSIVAWGSNTFGQCNVPAPNGGFIAVASGGYHSLGRKPDGTVVAWGYDYYGESDVPTPNTGFVAVSGGWFHSLGLQVRTGPATLALNGPTGCINGNQLVVSIDLSCAPAVIDGGQFFLAYDKTVLDFVSAVPGDAPFTREIYENVDESQGTIDYAIGTINGGTGTCADTTMARLTFNILQNVCSPSPNLVTWRASGPGGQTSKLSDDNGNEVQIDPVNLGLIKIDNTPPSITCPPDIIVNADAGSCSAVVTFTLPTATDNCDPSPVVTADPPSGSTFASGMTTVTLTATDSCNNSSTCTFTVTVNPVNEVVASVQLGGGVVAAGPYTRAITFQFWNTTVNPSAPLYTVCQTITFTNGLSGPVTLSVPCQATGYTCITARDRLHTLRRTITPLPTSGTQYVANFIVAKALISGNLNDDPFIDILDFGVFSWKWATNYGSGNTTCSTVYPHSDINGSGLVDTADFTFIQVNFLQLSEAGCNGLYGLTGLAGQPGPVTSISVRELRQRGLQYLAAGDLNGDGVLDEADIAAFLLGARPKPLSASAILDE